MGAKDAKKCQPVLTTVMFETSRWSLNLLRKRVVLTALVAVVHLLIKSF